MVDYIKGSSLDPEGVVTQRRREPLVGKTKKKITSLKKTDRELIRTIVDPDPKSARRVPGQEDLVRPTDRTTDDDEDWLEEEFI
jgi:hypothetical protein